MDPRGINNWNLSTPYYSLKNEIIRIKVCGPIIDYPKIEREARRIAYDRFGPRYADLPFVFVEIEPVNPISESRIYPATPEECYNKKSTKLLL